MSFDNSRFTFDPFKDYSGVVMQQGRVQSDADWNEWLAEISRRIQAGTLDIMGHAAYPATTPYAFQITTSDPGSPNTITIGVGRMYVDGLLAENHGDPTKVVWDPALAELSGSPQPPLSTSLNPVDYFSQPCRPISTPPLADGKYLAYLDVWKRPVTFIEDPTLVDVAIGIDTTARVQTAWQVKLWSMKDNPTWSCATPDSDIPWPTSSGQLTTGTITSGPTGPCCLTTGTGYTGVENQFYRVEIHNPGINSGANATFKWSRENASVQTNVTAIASGTNSLGASASVLTVQSLGRDQVLGFSPGNWIEITNQTLDDNCQSGELHQIDSVSVSSSSITLTTTLSDTFPASSLAANVNRYTRICRWDQSGKIYKSDQTIYYDLDAIEGGAVNGANGIPVPTDGSTLILQNGITVQFGLGSATGNYLAMDYWNFAARTADGSLNPQLTSAPPRGIYHHRTKLSIVTFGQTPSATDCRTKWPPSDSGDCGCGCCTVTVGDGVTSHGMYTSIQAALKALPANGGEVCILPGYYYENVVLSGLTDVVIHGCGWQTHVYSAVLKPGLNATPNNTPNSSAESKLNAVFTVVNCKHIEFRGFSVHAADDEVGILLDRTPNTRKKLPPDENGNVPDILIIEKGIGDADVAIEKLFVTASTLPAIIAVSVTRLKIAENRIAMKNVRSKYAAVYISGDEMFFEHNWVGLGQDKDSTPTTPVVNPAILDNDARLEKPLLVNKSFVGAPGGIQIAGPSKNVLVLENEIVGGQRNGITLGNFIILDANGNDTGTITGVTVTIEEDCCTGTTISIPGTTSDSPPARIAAGGLIENLHIDRNHIHDFGLCGIGAVGFFDLLTTSEVISLVNLHITTNIISSTMRLVARFNAKTSSFGYGAICVPDVQNLIIRDNTITDFGAIPGAEVCGIFVLYGEIVEISRNQIKETRDWTAPFDTTSNSSGVQAGILLLGISPPLFDAYSANSAWKTAGVKQNYSEINLTTPIFEPGLPALRIQENVVRVAAGPALGAFGFGPFEIADNHFASGGTIRVTSSINENDTIEPAETITEFLAQAMTVMILNLGTPIDFWVTLTGFLNLFASGFASRSTKGGPARISNGTVLFNNNVCQLEASLSGMKRRRASVVIMSLDHILFTSNHLWLDGLVGTARWDAFILGVTIQACMNRLQESTNQPVQSSLQTTGLANITSQNMSTYPMIAQGIPADSTNIVL